MVEGSLLVAPKGGVDADVEGARVTIQGTLAGNVLAAERIQLTPTADVWHTHHVGGRYTRRAPRSTDQSTSIDRLPRARPGLKLAPAAPAQGIKAR